MTAFAVLIAVSAAAFVATASAQLAWHDRDAIGIDATDYRLDRGDDPTVTITIAVSNPTTAAVTVRPSAVVVYDGRVSEATELTVPRTARAPNGDLTVPAGATATVTVVADVESGMVNRTAAAIESGDALASGTFTVTIGERSASVDV